MSRNTDFEDIESEAITFTKEILFKNVSYSWEEPENQSKSLLNLRIKKGEKISRNDRCDATGKKFKNCCGAL